MGSRARTPACQFHARHRASWFCGACQLPLCTTCIPGGDLNFRPGQPLCPVCLRSLDYLGDGEPMAPFWQRLPALLCYPLHRPLLVMSLLFGVLHGSALLVEVLFMALLLRYGLMVVTHVARGDRRPPPLSAALAADVAPFIRQVLVLAVLLALPLACLWQGVPFALPLLVLAALLVPASIMVLAVTDNLMDALNPLRWWRLVVVLGWPYLLAWLAWALMLLTVSTLPVAGGSLLGGFAAAMSMHLLLAGYAMMGDQLFEHAHVLGLMHGRVRGTSLPPDQYVIRQALGRCHVHVQRGDREAALSVIDAALLLAPEEVSLYEQKFRLLQDAPARPRFVRFVQAYLRLLLAQQRNAQALSVWAEVREALPAFMPEDDDVRVALAHTLVAQGRWQAASQLLLSMHERDRAPPPAQASLLLARVLLEGFGDTVQALRLIHHLRATSPATLATDEGSALLQLYRRLRRQHDGVNGEG